MVDTAQIADWLERNYKPAKLGNIAFKNAPLTAWLPHAENGGGEVVVLRWKYGVPQGVAAGSLANAITAGNAASLRPAKCHVDYELFYSYLPIDNPTIERAVGGGHSAANPFTEGMNGTMEAHGDHLETFLWADGFPTLGQITELNPAITGYTAANCIRVAQENIEKWETGMRVVFAANRTTGVLLDAGDFLTVTKVERNSNVIQFDGPTANIAGLAVNHFTFLQTTRENAASPTAQTLIGIDGYIPASVSGADSFGENALNRSVDPFRLAGVRMDIDAGVSTTAGLVDFFVRCKKYNINADALWVSYERWADLIKEQMPNVRYVDIENKKYGITLSGVKLATPNGDVPVLTSPKCPFNRVWALKRDSWKLDCVNGPLIQPAARYSKFLDDNSTDSIQLRFRSFCQLECLRPWENATGIYQ